jgi:hypothetical protein
MLEAVQFLNDDHTKITATQLGYLKESVERDSYSEGLVAGLWVGYLAAKGLVKELEGNTLGTSEQIDELIEYLGE